MTDEEIKTVIDKWLNHIHEWYYHDSDIINCPSGLRWKKTPRGGSGVKKDDTAGTPMPGGYFNIRIKGKNYRAHHVVAALLDLEGWRELREVLTRNPQDKSVAIDHVNGVECGNIRENLVCTTHRKNSQNTKKHRAVGNLGVSWVTSRKYWRAQIGIEGKNYHLGMFPTVETALEARALADSMYDEGSDITSIKKVTKRLAKKYKNLETVAPI